MPSIQKTAKGYRAQVAIKGVRDSQSFRTKREAEAWAFARENELRSSPETGSRYTLKQALNRYAEEVSPTKRGERWELVRIEAFKSEKSLPVDKKLCDFTPDDFGRWRDARLKVVSSGTVLRDISLLSAVLETARREWRWIPTNPISDIRKPRHPEHRSTLIKPLEAIKLLRAMSYHSGPCKSSTQAVCVAFLLAMRTGMRAGELCNLKWEHIKEGYCHLPVTKTVARDVPLVRQAKRLLDSMYGWNNENVFGLKPQTLDSLFRRYRDRAGLSHIHFHDARHTAATRLSKKLDVLSLCKVFGWKSTTQALTYYNPSANDLRALLEPGQSPKQGSDQKPLA